VLCAEPSRTAFVHSGSRNITAVPIQHFCFSYLALFEDLPLDWGKQMVRKIEKKEDAKATGSQRCKNHHCSSEVLLGKS